VKDVVLCRVCNHDIGQSAAARCQVCQSLVHYSCGVICRTCWTYVCMDCARFHGHFSLPLGLSTDVDPDEEPVRPCRRNYNCLRLVVFASLVGRVAAEEPSGDAWSWLDVAILVMTILAAVGVHRILTAAWKLFEVKKRTVSTQSPTTYRGVPGRFIP
jgi:hypothetical protein